MNEIKYSGNPRRIAVKDLNVGDFAVIFYGGKEHLVVRGYQALVSLTDPSKTWLTVLDNNDIPVEKVLSKDEEFTVRIK